METSRAPRATVRSAPLDWLRGIALLLVLLSHGWALWSTTALEAVPPVLNVIRSGNLAVSVFLVVAGFLLTRSLVGSGTRDDDDGRVGVIAAARPVDAVLSRVVRVSAQVYVLLAVVVLVALVDPKEILTFGQTMATVGAVATFTWNWYLQTSSPIARPDLGHLWYTAVYVQVTLVLVLLVRSLRHRRLVLLAVVAAVILACSVWRPHVAASEGAYLSLLRTTTRMDGMFWGALVALAWPWLVRARAHATTIAGWSLLGLVALTLSIGHSMTYMGWGGVGVNLCVAGFVVATPGLVDHPRWVRLTSWSPLVALGRMSLAVYVWHYPVFMMVARHGGGWPTLTKVAVSFAVIALAVAVTTRWVERPAARLAERLLRRGGTAPAPAEAPVPAPTP
ncbi:acyltransferase family protein [Oryzobacter telluris]|uniref:acyltransferase family protein n=1 Tax=Oryzobacter telluris TaxID=3149179 RepID=UPI00370D4E20